MNAWTFGLLIASIEGYAHGLDARHIVPGAVAALVLGYFFVRRQLHRPYPLLPVDLFRIPIFSMSIATSVCSFTAQMLAMVSLPFFLQSVCGRSEVDTGLLLTAWPVAIIFVAPLAGLLVERVHAGVLGGITESLRALGVPPATTTDGPSGIRLRATCSLLPSGTALACSWNLPLVQDLYATMGREMVDKGTDVLLAPGMNIHRNPLCGRNFEYFSEDPLVTGKLAAAVVQGLQSAPVSACPKHFACNNQEYNRNHNNSVVSARAMREIYLRGFEICIKEAHPKNLMTSYNKINGVWSHYNYQLCTALLREEWGYTGNVMTDWWMRYAASPEFPELRDNGYRVRAQVDVLMPGAKTAISKSAPNDGSLLATLGKPDGITLGELQRTAKNVLRMTLRTKFAGQYKD